MLVAVWTKTVRDRWRGSVIAAVTMGLLLLMGMSVYRDIDLAAYTNLPEVMRTLMNIPADADVASLSYGAIYSSYGALTLAAMALSLGSASIAGEERDGTMGLLLGNPKSRLHVLGSKALSLVLLAALGSAILLVAAWISPIVLDVNVTGMRVGALIFHMFVNALFYGSLAMALSAWTGKRVVATGIAAGVMVVSFFAEGLLPLIEGWDWLARFFPWYYFASSQPVFNGIDWGHLSVLLGATAGFGIVAVVGVTRRDLRSKTVGVTLVDRLRSSPLTQKVANRLAGSTRVSRISIKTASEHQGLLIIVAYLMFFVMGLLIGPIYGLIDDALFSFSDQFPEALLALFGGGDMGTPEGFYQVETFGLMAPIGVMVVTIAVGARALAGEEANRTMGLLLANPIKRSRVVFEKTGAMAFYAFVVGFATFAGVAAGSLLGGMGISIGNIAATCLLVTLVGLVFGALSLALSAATGQTRIAIYGAIGAALAFHVMNAFLPFNDSMADFARVSPFYYYLTSDPLNNGMNWGHGAVLAALTVALIWLAVWLFDRRDIRQTG